MKVFPAGYLAFCYTSLYTLLFFHKPIHKISSQFYILTMSLLAYWYRITLLTVTHCVNSFWTHCSPDGQPRVCLGLRVSPRPHVLWHPDAPHGADRPRLGWPPGLLSEYHIQSPNLIITLLTDLEHSRTLVLYIMSLFSHIFIQINFDSNS